MKETISSVYDSVKKVKWYLGREVSDRIRVSYSRR